MNQKIYLIGFNHKTAPVDVRERFAISDCSLCEDGLVCKDGPIREALILSTCNRVEFLIVCDGDPLEQLLHFWAGSCCLPKGPPKESLYIYEGLAAVRHLFEVACSLDSMVVGEPQILGQLKKAYKEALEQRSAGVIINRLVHKSFSAAKRVRTETAIASSAVSISYAAVELAKSIFGDLSTQSAMLIGAGEMAELAATHLLNSGLEKIYVANRTLQRAEELAERFNGQAVLFDSFYDYLEKTDIVISSTGSPTAVINAREVKATLKQRRNRPMFFIDIAVPRDIDPDVNSLDNVFLYDIDDLKDIVEENMAGRLEEAKKAKRIVEFEVDGFAAWLDALELTPTIVDINKRNSLLVKREVAKTLRRLGLTDDKQACEALAVLGDSLARKICHDPIMYLKRRAEEDGKARESIHLFRRFFNLDSENEKIPASTHEGKKKIKE